MAWREADTAVPRCLQFTPWHMATRTAPSDTPIPLGNRRSLAMPRKPGAAKARAMTPNAEGVRGSLRVRDLAILRTSRASPQWERGEWSGAGLMTVCVCVCVSALMDIMAVLS